jgi:hypothetical protein
VRSFADRRIRELLVVEDNELERNSLIQMLGYSDVRLTAVGTAAEALAALRKQEFDCLILDLRLPDAPGLELLESIKRELGLHDLPVIVYTGKDLTRDEDLRLKELAEAIISKDPRSTGLLREKTALFLHQVEDSAREHMSAASTSAPVAPLFSAMPATEAPPAPPHSMPELDQDFAGKKVLIVDDDIRNLFALTSALEQWKLNVLRTESGAEALEILHDVPDIDLVLMDIMMPGMDGYETMRRMRSEERFQRLPIIALTAKALKDDRDKCLAAGAWDYLAKPVSTHQLLERLRVWLTPRNEQLPV